MIVPTSRLEEMVRSIEAGETVDTVRLSQLQMLDTILLGRQFLAESLQTHEDQCRVIEQFFNTGEWPASNVYRRDEEHAVG